MTLSGRVVPAGMCESPAVTMTETLKIDKRLGGGIQHTGHRTVLGKGEE